MVVAVHCTNVTHAACLGVDLLCVRCVGQSQTAAAVLSVWCINFVVNVQGVDCWWTGLMSHAVCDTCDLDRLLSVQPGVPTPEDSGQDLGLLVQIATYKAAQTNKLTVVLCVLHGYDTVWSQLQTEAKGQCH